MWLTYDIELSQQSRAHLVDVIFEKWKKVFNFFTLFMLNQALATVSCTFCRQHLQKVQRKPLSFLRYLC